MGSHPRLSAQRRRSLHRQHRLGLVLLPDQADLLAAARTQHLLIGNMGWAIIA
jgi:hypothetical protein